MSFEDTTTLAASRGRGEGRTVTATMFRKMLSKYAVFIKRFVQDCRTISLGIYSNIIGLFDKMTSILL